MNHYYVLCNVLTGSILEVSEEVLIAEGHPVTMKVFDGDIPNPLTHVWDKASMGYIPKEVTSLTHIQFRKLFTPSEEIQVDTFNDTYQNSEMLSGLQKATIRTGLKKYQEAQAIELNDSGVSALLDLYIMVGILDPARKQEIISGQFKQS